MAVKNPHDRFFKKIMGEKEQAVSFIENYLPEAIVKEMKLDSLDLLKDTFVSEDLKEFYSDLIYKVELKGNDAYIYTLFDHKSYVDKNLPIQLLKYITLLLEKETSENNIWKKLPVIFPVVFYHGKDKWNIVSNFIELYDVPAKVFENYLPKFEYFLCDLSKYNDDQIKGDILLQVSLLTFKHIFDKRESWKSVLPRLTKLLSQLGENDHVLNYVRAYLTYLMDRADVSKDDVKQMIESSFPSKGDKLFMTPAQELKLEGEQIGKIKGEIALLDELLKEGTITVEKYNEKANPLKEKLINLENNEN